MDSPKLSLYEIKELLDKQASAINSPQFIADDPVQFPRRFEDGRDIEIVSLLISSIAWGRRAMILRNAEKMLSLMDYQPYLYVMDEGYEDLPDNQNIHRTFFSDNFKYFLRGLHHIYKSNSTLDDFCRTSGAAQSELPAWHLAKAINFSLAEANRGATDSRCLPVNTDTSALKRLNMALRWLVRNDGIVDLGIWRSLTPAQLFVPLDVHVGNVSRQLGLLQRKSADRRAVVELTDVLRNFRPHDPVLYDYALFGIGVSGSKIFS